MNKFWPFLALLTLPVAGDAVLTREQAAMSLGQTYTANFYRGDMVHIWQHMTEQMRAALGSEDALRQFGKEVGREIGAEFAVIAERVESVAEFRTYTR